MEKYYKHIIRVGGERRRTSEKDCHCPCHYLRQLKTLYVVRVGRKKGGERGEDIRERLSLSLSLLGTAKIIKCSKRWWREG